MRSLDSVIEAIDNCLVDPCQECPVYVNDKCRKDSYASFYLKEYREMLNNVENEPLEWEELLKMVGKPIWIEGSSVLAHWMIIADIRPDCLTCRGMLICRGRFGENVPFFKEDLGRTWLAYKKERMKRDNEHITSVYDK